MSRPLDDIKWAYTLRSLAPVEMLGGWAVRGYRLAALRRLGVEPGMRVLDLACGAGRSLPWLARAVGPSGEVVGVDYTRAMLERARLRVERGGFANVRLIEADASDLVLPAGSFDRVLCAHALSVIPRSRQALQVAVNALKPGGRLVVLDMKRLAPPLASLAPIYDQVLNPLYEQLAYQLACADPSREIVTEMRRVLGDVRVEEHMGGALYLAWGEKPREVADKSA